MLKKLNNLKEVIENYQFQGSDGIIREVEIILGSMALSQGKIKNKDEVSLFQKVFELLCKILSAASAAKKLLPEGATEVFQNLLPPGK